MEVKGDGSDLNLQRRLGRSNGSYVYEENLIDSLLRCEPTEIAEDEFKLLKKDAIGLAEFYARRSVSSKTVA